MSLKLRQFLSVPELLHSVADRYSDRVAVQVYHDEDDQFTEMTYAELARRATVEGDKLKALGVQPGDRIALIEDNSIHWCIAFFAILNCRATAVLFDPRMEVADYDRLFGLADPQFAIINEKFLDKIPKSLTNCLMFLDIQRGLNHLNGKKTIIHGQDRDETIALLMFTSGTAGSVKAVMLEHKALLNSISMTIDAIGLSSKEEYLSMLPLTHIYGLTTFLFSISRGMTTTLIIKIQSDLVLKIMRKTGTTIFGTVPRVLELFHAKIEQRLQGRPLLIWLKNACGAVRDKTGLNLGRLFFFPIHRLFGGCKYFLSGGASLDLHVQADLQSLGFSIIQGYGLTETTARIVGTSARKPIKGITGWASENVKLRIVPLSDHTDGEICVQSPTLMRGYFRDPAATEQVMQEGWFHTGDLGHLDKQGYLTITGRVKDVIVTPSGLKAMPLDIEDRYKGLSGVYEMAVVGMPIGNGLSEEIHAAIIPSDEIKKKDLSPEELKDKLKQEVMIRSEQIPSHLRIHHIHVVSALPKTLTFKVKREELRRQLKALVQQERNGPKPEESHDPITKGLLKIIRRVCTENGKQVNNLNLGMSFELDLHFDSLTSLECVFAIEEYFHIRIQQPSTIKTIGDLDQLIRHLISVASSEEKKLVPFRHELAQEREVNEQDRKYIEGKPSMMQSFLFGMLGLFYRIFFRFEVEGEDYIPEGPFILCSNHTSHLDAPTLILGTGLSIKNFRVLAAEDYFFKASRFKRFVRNLLNLVPFSRVNNKHEIMRNFDIVRECIRNKKNIILFPEGTRAVDGNLKQFKSFIGILGSELTIPIVPAYIQGAFECWPKGQKMPKRGRIRLAFGKPIMMTASDKAEGLGDFNAYAALTQKIHDAVEGLRDRSKPSIG